MTRKAADAALKMHHFLENATNGVKDPVTLVYGYVLLDLGCFLGLPVDNFFQ